MGDRNTDYTMQESALRSAHHLEPPLMAKSSRMPAGGLGGVRREQEGRLSDGEMQQCLRSPGYLCEGAGCQPHGVGGKSFRGGFLSISQRGGFFILPRHRYCTGHPCTPSEIEKGRAEVQLRTMRWSDGILGSRLVDLVVGVEVGVGVGVFVEETEKEKEDRAKANEAYRA